MPAVPAYQKADPVVSSRSPLNTQQERHPRQLTQFPSPSKFAPRTHALNMGTATELLVSSSYAFRPERQVRRPSSNSSISRKSRSANGSHPHESFLRLNRGSISDGKRHPLMLLDVIVCGGGVAGLATAFALARHGHRVRVIERTDGVSQRSGGIRVPPNLTKILSEWGLSDQLRHRSQRVLGSTFVSFETGEPIGYLEWNDDVIKETGADFLVMHHADLLQMLRELAISVGVVISYNQRVASVDVDSSSGDGRVTLVNGTTMTADLIVGADGANSLVRRVVAGDDNEPKAVMSVFTFTIPTDSMRLDPELAPLADLSEWPCWMGDRKSVMSYSVVMDPTLCANVPKSWDVVFPSELLPLDGCEDRLRRIAKLSKDSIRAQRLEYPPLEDWVHPSCKIILLGDAAHPSIPCTMHNTSLAIEDAAVLGSLFSRVRSEDQIPELLSAYQELRQERCNMVISSEMRNAALVWLPPGPEREGRDAYMRQMMSSGHEHWDEGTLRKQWEDIAEVFGYNAREAAEEWWVDWGSLRESSKEKTLYEPLGLQFQVTETRAMVT